MGLEGYGSLPANADPGQERRPEYGPIFLDLKTRTLQGAGTDKREQLSPIDYQILWLLIRARGALISNEEMQNFIDGTSEHAEENPLMANSINQHLLRVRLKLHEVVGNKVTLENDHGFGYKLVLNAAT